MAGIDGDDSYGNVCSVSDEPDACSERGWEAAAISVAV